MELVYKQKWNWIIFLDDLGNEKETQEINIKVFEKFKEKYKNNILEKEALGLCNIKKIFFFYPYSLGYWYPKTNIAKLIQIAKTGDLEYCQKVFELVKEKVLDFSSKYDAIVFVPYSVERNCNFLVLLKDYLKENNINIIDSFRIKPGNEIKNIKKLKEKFEVASKKFDIEKNLNSNIKKILIIDDMVNTWASMCAIANKFDKNLQIDWLWVVWSLSNEIISDI